MRGFSFNCEHKAFGADAFGRAIGLTFSFDDPTVAALAMEIDGTEYAEKILRLLRCNKWRIRAEQLAASQGELEG